MLRSRSSCLAPGTARDGAGVKHHGGASAFVETGDGMLQPGPIAFASGDAALRAKTVERVVVEHVGIERLIPHGIGDDYVVGLDPAGGSLEFGVDHSVAAHNVDFHIVNDGVHAGDGVAFGLKFLTAKPECATAGGVEFAGDEL